MTSLPPNLAGQGHPAAGQTSRRPILLIAIGVAFLGLVLLALVANIALIARAKAAEASQAQVVVATTDIAPGIPLTAENVALVSWAANAVRPEKVFTDVSLVIGRVSSIPLYAGDPITETKLAKY